eukprot:13188049-Alexandrium_andersonii.AAC.1
MAWHGMAVWCCDAPCRAVPCSAKQHSHTHTHAHANAGPNIPQAERYLEIDCVGGKAGAR